jgi:tRNA threonylcarbamoyladenosine biosynthesis protein TsaE
LTVRELQLLSLSSAETHRIAATVAGALRLGDVVARALGVPGRVTSPSFVLRREYQGQVPVLHLDVYRLSSLQEVLDIGYEEAVEGNWVTFIEWGDAMSPLLPVDHLEVEFRLPEPTGPRSEDAEPRVLMVRAHGHEWARRMAGLSAVLHRWRKDA